MSRAKIVSIVAVLLVAVAGIGAAVVAMFERAVAPMNQLRVYEPAPFATPAEAAEGCEIPIPPEAKNVRTAGWSQWIAHETYVRFEAPVAICLKHAAVVVPDEPLAPVTAAQLASDAALTERGIFQDLSWFDLAAAQNVVGAGGGSQRPRVWIDRNKGVFYYRRTD